jgi:hypothetical protein
MQIKPLCQLTLPTLRYTSADFKLEPAPSLTARPRLYQDPFSRSAPGLAGTP